MNSTGLLKKEYKNQIKNKFAWGDRGMGGGGGGGGEGGWGVGWLTVLKISSYLQDKLHTFVFSKQHLGMYQPVES